MSKYYIVSRNGNSFDLIKVGDKTILEEIDLYTLNFNNKQELINDMNLKGNTVSPDSDLFIVYKSRSKISKGRLQCKEILYKDERNYNIKDNIELSLNGDVLKYYNIFKEVFELSKDYDFNRLLSSYEYGIYKDFNDLLLNSDRNITRIRFDRKNAWLRTSYSNLRDLCVLMGDFDKATDKSFYTILSNKNDLMSERNRIIDQIGYAFNDDFGQYSLFDGPENFIHITSLNKEEIPESHSLAGSKVGNIKQKSEIVFTTSPDMALEIDSKKYKLDLASIRKINLRHQSSRDKQLAVRNILDFLTSDYYMPSEAIKTKDNKYYIDFSVFDCDYSDDEKKYLSSLMTQNIMRSVKGFKICNDKMKDPFISYSTVAFLDEDRNEFREDIKRCLDRYVDRNSESINKIYRFYQVQKDVVDNTKGRSR